MPDDNPENLLHVTKPRDTAAGRTAIAETMKNAFGKMGVVRGTRGLLSLNQKGGIDCQSCAWPDPEKRTIAEFCESGAKALADEGTTLRITRDFFAEHSIADLAEKGDYWLNSQGRLTEPVVLRKGATNYTPIPWADAFELIAGELNSLASPDEAIFYTSGRTSNEAAFLYQLFVRQFGTNNMPDCSNMCHESSGIALGESIGLGKATVRLSDFEQTDLVIVIGQNPGTNAPRMMTSLEDAKRAGAKMIAINPLPEAGLLNFADPNPPMLRKPLTEPSGPWTTYGPAPAAGANCVFSLDADGVPIPRLEALGDGLSLIRLAPERLSDGPWCPDASSPGRYDADLLRVRAIAITVRVEAAPASLRGAGPRFIRPGTSPSAARVVADQSVRFTIAPPNLRAMR